MKYWTKIAIIICFLALPHDSFGLARCEGEEGCSSRWMLPATSSESDDQGGAPSLRAGSPWSRYEAKGNASL